MPGKNVFRKCDDENVPYRLFLFLNVRRCHSLSTMTKLRISSVISRVLNNRSLFLLKILEVQGINSSCTCIVGVSIIVRCPQASVMLARVLLQFSFRKHVVLEWKLPLTRMIVLLPHIAVMAGRIREACQLLRYFVNLPVSTQLFILFFFTCTCM